MYKIKLFLIYCVFVFSTQITFAAKIQPILINNINKPNNINHEIKVNNVIKGSISMTDRVPAGFFGSWKVVSVRAKTTSPQDFGPYGVDVWNLSKSNNVITLSNPVSGAKASILVSEVNGSTVRFKKTSHDVDEESIETPVLTLEGDNFYGIDRIVVRSYKNGVLVKEDSVEYKVKATKMSGATIPELFGN